MLYTVQFTKSARDDLKCLYHFFLNQDGGVGKQALLAINNAIAILKCSPFTCRKAQVDNPFLRELFISFDGNGYVALIEIEESKLVNILAVRHQLEDDYY